MYSSHIELDICSIELVSDPKNPWMIMIHGFGGTRHMWKRQVEEFKHDFNIMILELPGHGDSVHGAADHPDTNLLEIAKNLVKHIHSKGITKADFLCLSLGSLVMSAIVDVCPEMVNSVLLCGAICGMRWYMKSFLVLGNILKYFLPFMMVIRLLAWILMPRPSHKISRKFLVQESKKLGRKEFQKWFGILTGELDRLKGNLHKFRDLNTYVVMGDEDFVFIGCIVDEVKKHEDVIRLEIMDHCGHVCCLQKWREFNPLARKFFVDDRKTETIA